MFKHLLLALVLVCPSYAQELKPLSSILEKAQDVTISQVTYVRADSAEVIPSDGGVIIFAEGLKSDKQLAVKLLIENQEVTSLEVSKLVEINGLTFAVFPPTVVPPLPEKPNTFIITGDSGERFGVSIRSSGSPQWLEVKIAGEPEAPEQPNIDVSDIEKVRGPDDPITRDAILSSLKQLKFTGTLDDAIVATRLAISNALLDAPAVPPYKDWKGEFRDPINKIIERLLNAGQIRSIADWQLVVNAMIKALQPTTTSKIIMTTSPNCQVCKDWKRNVLPYIKGWRFEEVTDTTVSVPRFQICDGDKCSNVIVGYMSIDAFNSTVYSLRGE